MWKTLNLLEIPLRRSRLQQPGVPPTRGPLGCFARARSEAGFTLIEMIFTSLILVIISAPIAGVLLASSSQAVQSRQRTAADQLIQAKLETLRTMPYTQVGLVGGQPVGNAGRQRQLEPARRHEGHHRDASDVGHRRDPDCVRDARRLQEGRDHDHAPERRQCSFRRTRPMSPRLQPRLSRAPVGFRSSDRSSTP